MYCVWELEDVAVIKCFSLSLHCNVVARYSNGSWTQMSGIELIPPSTYTH